MLHNSNAQGPGVGNAGWSECIREYVACRNKAEIELTTQPLADMVSDSTHLARLGARLDRLNARDRGRLAYGAHLQTEARPVKLHANGGEVSVLLELRGRRNIDQGGSSYTEERLEWEWIWLAGSGRSWTVLRVEPLISERRPQFPSPNARRLEPVYPDSFGASSSSVSQKSVSAPYLNYNLLPDFMHRRANAFYRRDLAAAYADLWWDKANPAYEEFEVNCTNYVSQCLFAGNAPMNYTGKRNSGWWYKGRSDGREWWSYSWSVSNSLQQYLSASHAEGIRAEAVDSPEQLQLGDVICYDWYGDSHYHHSTVVTAFDRSGMPLVNANTVPSRHRYWDYKDSYAWTEQTRYRFFHIADEFN